jgi:hypothetical protein
MPENAGVKKYLNGLEDFHKQIVLKVRDAFRKAEKWMPST